MKCPFCSCDELKVTDSRIAYDVNAIKRRRECLKCQKRFTTFETIDLIIQVKKRNGTYEDFSQEKLIKGLSAACYLSKVSHNQILALVAEVTSDLMTRQIMEVSSQELGEIVMEKLKEMDIIAYIRFACVYRRFKKVEDLLASIKSITSKDEVRNKENILCQ